MKKFKIAAIFLAVVICILALTSCKDKNGVPSGMTEVVSEYTDFRLFIPENWTPDVATGFVSAQTLDKSNISVQVLTTQGIASSDNDAGYVIKYNDVTYAGVSKFFEDYYFYSLSQTLSGVKLEEQYTSGQSLGENTYACKYIYTVSVDGTDYKIMQVLAPRANKIYVFTYTATAENFASHTDDVEKITENFIFA